MKKFILLALIILIGCSKEIPEPGVKPTQWQVEQTFEQTGILHKPVPEYDWYIEEFLTNECDTFYGEPIMYAMGLKWPDSIQSTLGVFSWHSAQYVICKDYIEASGVDINVYLHDGPGRIDTVVWSSGSPDLIVDTIWREDLYPGYVYDDLEPSVLRFRSARDSVKVRIHAIGINRDDIQ